MRGLRRLFGEWAPSADGSLAEAAVPLAGTVAGKAQLAVGMRRRPLGRRRFVRTLDAAN
ncbi:MAG TPA: hypothetical protein VGP70_13325 [Actinomadura sp.]|nr:hypothetical protein [Actinomadura sp.]